MPEDISGELHQFLTDPATFGEASDAVEIVETHAARVFLCGGRALKVKKAVRYPYLDFSTEELRRRACEREIELNRPNAPDLYLGLVDIVRGSDGGLALGGEGDVVETALDMRRFDRDQLLDRMAERGQLDLSLMGPLADAVRRAHERAPVIGDTDPVAALEDVIAGNVESLRQHGDIFPADVVARIAGRSEAELAHAAPVLAERARAGYVRRCHGDLHLGNIVMWHVRPTLFDALEFDEALATIDVLYDLAFLLMDLVHRDLRPHANAVLNRYLARESAESLAGLTALPLLMSVRAAVRAKVAADRAASVSDPSETDRSIALAREYLDLADRCLNPVPLRLVAIGGLSGSGKSTVAARIAARIGGPAGALLLRSDVERKSIAGVAEGERLPSEHYTQAATRRVYESLRERARVALEARSAVVVDAVHAREDERSEVADIAFKGGALFYGLWLDAAPDVLRSRVSVRRHDASDADERVVEQQLAYDLGKIDWHIVDAGGTPDETWANACTTLELDQ